MKTNLQLLHLLADGSFYSGEVLGAQLEISRAGVWKNIQQLIKLGVEIEATPKLGYRIPGGLELLDKNRILKNLEPEYNQLINDLQIFEQINSTHTYLTSLALKKSEDSPPERSQNGSLAVFAEYQTHAKGRRGRKWIAPFGHNIYFSLLWSFHKDPGEIIGLSLAIAVATVRALQNYGGFQQLGLKWPNDVLFAGKKLAGILIDLMAESHSLCKVIISVGINTHIPDSQSLAIDQPWTSLDLISPTKIKRNELAAILLKHILLALNQFESHGLIPFLEEWCQLDYMQDKKICVITPQEQFEGTMNGISNRGELILRQENNSLKYFLSGDVSLRMKKDTYL